jgi:hypothetical protein
MRLMAICLGVVLALVSMPAPSVHADVDRAQAIRVCQAAVLGRLKAPRTARFVSADYAYWREWTVEGEVGAENTYGAMIRGIYRCNMIGLEIKDVQIYTPK